MCARESGKGRKPWRPRYSRPFSPSSSASAAASPISGAPTRLLDLIFPVARGQRRGGGRQSAPARHDPPVAVHRPGADHPRRLPDLSGRRDALPLLPRPGGDNFVGLANYPWAFGDREFRNSILNNLLWLAVVPAACTFLGLVIAVLTDKHLVGHHRQEPDLPAARHLLRRRQRDLEVHLRVSRRGPDADRHPQRHHPGSRRHSRRSGYRCRSGTTSS